MGYKKNAQQLVRWHNLKNSSKYNEKGKVCGEMFINRLFKKQGRRRIERLFTAHPGYMLFSRSNQRMAEEEYITPGAKMVEGKSGWIRNRSG